MIKKFIRMIVNIAGIIYSIDSIYSSLKQMWKFFHQKEYAQTA